MSAYTNLTNNYSNGNNPNIEGRDNELNHLFLTLLKQEKPNALLIGNPGNGKTSIVHQLAYRIANQLCPKELVGFKVIEVNTNALLSGDGYRGVTEKKFDEMIQGVLKQGKVILFIDEFHTAENLGKMANGSTPGLGNTLKPFLTRGDFRMIGATTLEELATIEDKALLRRFTKINVGELAENPVKKIIEICYKKYLGDNSVIKVDKKVIDRTYNLSLTLEGSNPDKAKDIVDVVVANAKFTETKLINVDFLEQTFDTYFLVIKKPKINNDVFA